MMWNKIEKNSHEIFSVDTLQVVGKQASRSVVEGLDWISYDVKYQQHKTKETIVRIYP